MEKNHNYNFGMEHRSEEVVCKYIIHSLWEELFSLKYVIHSLNIYLSAYNILDAVLRLEDPEINKTKP